MREGSHTRSMVVAGLLAALLAASAWISIPLGSVPLTLQVLIVVLIALVLPVRWAAGAVLAYLLVGAVGLPVFASARGGLAVLVGPTGGYLFGFLGGVWLGAWVRAFGARRISVVVADGLAAFVVISVVYALGWLQLAAVTGISLGLAFASGVAPFIALDAAKAVVAIGIAAALRRSGAIDTPITKRVVTPSR